VWSCVGQHTLCSLFKLKNEQVLSARAHVARADHTAQHTAQSAASATVGASATAGSASSSQAIPSAKLCCSCLQVQSCQAAWGWDLWQCLESNQQTNKRGGEQQLHRQDAAGAGSACSPASYWINALPVSKMFSAFVKSAMLVELHVSHGLSLGLSACLSC
jgi:hypothetical protein